MSFLSRPMPTRQPSSTSNHSTLSRGSSAPDASLLTPSYAIIGGAEDYSAPPSPSYVGSKADYGILGSPKFQTGEGSKSPVTPGRERVMSEMDNLAYKYALRVAALHHHLNAPPLASPSIPLPPSPKLNTRKSFSFLRPSQSSTPPLPSNPHLSPSPQLPTPRSPSISERTEVKLPKEYLIELWGKIAEEPGDQVWVESKRRFLAGIKKGSRNEQGGNMREVGVLLDTFLSYLPPQCPAHMHQTHLLQILSTSLPQSAYFNQGRVSPRDTELLRRLRGEISGYILGNLAPAGEQGIQLHERGQARRDAGEMGQMEEVVGRIFGLNGEKVRRDLEDIRQEGEMDELYITHLQQCLAYLNALPHLTSTQRKRHADLTQTLTALLTAHPNLARITSSSFASSTFFTPPRKLEVYSHLCEKAEENLTLQPRAQALVDECVKVWAVPGETEREKEVEGVIIAWTRSVGKQDEGVWGNLLEEGVGDLCAGGKGGMAMDNLLNALLAMLGKATEGILRDVTRGLGCRAPPASLLPLVRGGEGVFMDNEKTKRRLAELSDDVKGGAVGAYVDAVGTYMGGMGDGREQVEGYKKVADWIEGVVAGLRDSWGDGLGKLFNPASIVLSKQLPLFFAELQTLDAGSAVGTDSVFGLYEVVGRLSALLMDICPGIEHGFEVDAFFEPYVIAWLRETEASKVNEWVSRAVALDRWSLDGQAHSQSLTDVFDCIRQPFKAILQDLPLSPPKRAIYLTDVARTASLAIEQYSTTLHALFQVDMNPPKAATAATELGNRLNDKLGGKAGGWLAKGQQAMKVIEKKRVEGFVIPPQALVKMVNIGDASTGVEDLLIAVDPEETARYIPAKLRQGGNSTAQTFEITVGRGIILIGKGQNKMDAFCVITDKSTGERLIKTRTALGVEEPSWDQSFEVNVDSVKHLDISIFDRSLVGKHDMIGSALVKLDPRSWTANTKNIVVPLQPRGYISLRISTSGRSDKYDIRSTLASSTRSVERVQREMSIEVVERMMEYVRDQLSGNALTQMTKPKDKKKGRLYVSDHEVEASLGGVFHYLNVNFSTFSSILPQDIRLSLLLDLWTRILDHLTSLLVPPLSDRLSTLAPTPADQAEIVLKWLQHLKTFFNAREGSTEHGVKLTTLQGGVYKDVMMLGQYFDLPTPALKERAAAAVKAVMASGRDDGERMAEVLLRIVRTRADASDFLAQQVGALMKARTERYAGVL